MYYANGAYGMLYWEFREMFRKIGSEKFLFLGIVVTTIKNES